MTMKRVLALCLAVLMIMSLAACSKPAETSTPETKATTAPTTAPTSATPSTSSATKATTEPSTSNTTEEPTAPAPTEPKILHLAASAAATNTFALASSASADTSVQSHIQGKLYAFLPINGKSILSPVLAAAEPVDVNGDGKTWNIVINPAAKWENGESMNADTFIYSYKWALDPVLLLARGGDVATNTVEILNAKAYYTQATSDKKVSWDEVGIKKVDDMTIQIVLKGAATARQVMQHFANSCTIPIYEPLFEKCLSADKTSTTYGTTLETTISSGPFKLTQWQQGALRVYEKNEYYARQDLVKLDGIEQRVVENAGTRLQMFENGEIDSVSLDADALEKYGDDPRIVQESSRYVRTIEISLGNTQNPIINNKNFRLALYYGIDRAALAELTHYVPGIGIVQTPVAKDDGTTFRELAEQAGYMPKNDGYDPELAKQYFETALKEEGLTKVEITLMYVTTIAIHGTTAEFLQESWSQLFGKDRFTLKLNGLPSAQSREIRTNAQKDPNAYELSFGEWTITSSDYDPIMGFQPYTLSKSNRNAAYGDPTLEALWAEAMSDSLNMDKRNECALKMEQYIIENAIVIPTLYHISHSMLADRVVPALDSYDITIGNALDYCDIVE